MIISIKTQTEFTPEWMGNKQDDNPITIEHLTPTMHLHNELVSSPSVKMNINKAGEYEGGETEMVLDNRKIVKKMVTKIHNLTIEVDGKPMEFKTGSDLFGPGAPAVMSGLIDEVGAYLQGLLNEKKVNEKN